MEYKIANIISMMLIILILVFVVYFVIAVIIRKKKNVPETEKKARAKILFKSIDEYDKTNLTNLTTYHKRNLYLDCLIDGEKKTLLCSEYMFDFVQKGETYDVVYTSDHIELDREYYPEDFDDYFDDPDSEE